MRKIIASILAAVLTIGTAAMEVSANTTEKPNISRVCPLNGTNSGNRRGNGGFVDNDNDGICDYCANGVRPQNGTGSGNRCGNSGFVDNDNDGICDNYANGVCPQNSTGGGNRCGNGGGRRRAKV